MAVSRPKHIEASDTVKQAILQHRRFTQWSYSIHHKRNGTRDEVEGIVCDLLWQILELMDAVEKEYGPGAMLCSEELAKAYRTYHRLVDGDV